MNRVSALGAVRITPPTEGDLRWSDDATQLTFTPATTLEPDADYMILVGGEAMGSWWRPIVAPRTIRFHTAPLPAVIAALPSATGAPIDGSLAIIFSQAMVPADQIGRLGQLPQLQIDPPTPAHARWLDETTLLIRPDSPLRAATRYTATIAPDLADLRGVDLGRPFSWSWSTDWPEPLDRAPADGTRWVSPSQPLVLTLSAPLDPALLRSALAINPPVEGAITTAQIGATQVVTFTPRLGWEYGRSYWVGLASDDPDLAPPPDLGWRFSVEPRPGLIAFSPGQGQALAAGQDVRLIFSTPMDEAALRDGLRIDPPVGDLSMDVSETEVRLRPSLRPSSTYTITVSADTPDRSGEPLGLTTTVQLRAAPAAPALRAPTATANVISLPISQTAQIALERINLSRLDLTLYQLDAPTAVRAMGLAPDEWYDFSPERYGQSSARSWQLPLSDPADTPTRAPVTVALADDAPLPAGIYYLRVRSPEGPRANLLLQVSPLDLTLRQSDSQVLVWATDRASGEPVADVSLLLYAGESRIARGRTDAAGVWAQPIQRPNGGAPYLALADAPALALVRGDWLAAPAGAAAPQFGSMLFLDRLSYRPGDSARVGGIARAFAADGSLELPAVGTPCWMQLEPAASLTPIQTTACAVSASGALSGTLNISPSQPLDNYSLAVLVGNSITRLPLRMADAAAPVEISFADAGGLVTLRATRSGLPLAGATVSWTLDLEPLAIATDPEGFSFDAQVAPTERLSGSGTTDPDGRLNVALPAREALEGPLHYRLRAELRAGDDQPAIGLHAGQILPADDRVGLRLSSRVVLSDERTTVDLLSLAADGSPAPGRRVGVAVYRDGDRGGAPVI
ncbi:Ig-like domain-containing protein, partial [Oscillochloris sp. ZM17-4]|uniref:Ig-like domain-containing alpha-2-macroglobulin family protein n=1 Tax=Oscillochloris sp. ZM17-4 TaxID=2866714 RepID=UPI001C73BF75